MPKKLPTATLELWGGIECTLNRVRDQYFNQTDRTDHRHRLSDLDQIAALGIKTLRYPILWENLAPENPEEINWSWADERMHKLREVGISPIVTLVHHGSGPRYATFDQPEFVTGLAEFARKVAARYPWVTDFTPINEPLTTARFAGLYGHWYPHAQDATVFARIFLNECQATRAAMQAIREVTPQARLIQTEDLGYTHSTRALRYQARFENNRRWLTFDLLLGKVTESHPLYQDLLDWGISPGELQTFVEQPCPPDVLGINHYVTSERYLDTWFRRYPKSSWGGNQFNKYADVEAVRVRQARALGPEKLFRQVWRRYKMPFAITEAHLCCSPEEQVRWFHQVWQEAQNMRERSKAELLAVTSWSLFGAFDWNSLLTREAGHFELGAFDLRSSPPRPTALAKMLRSLAEHKSFDHPVLDTPGWWQRPHRILYHPRGKSGKRFNPEIAREQPARPVLITGATGTLGQALARGCSERGLSHVLLNRAELDIASVDSVKAAFDRFQPWAIINAAGYVRVDDAEQEPDLCFRENTLGPAVLAEVCAERGIQLLTYSSDLVFNGLADQPYSESSKVEPLNVYGKSKAEAERKVLTTHPEALVIRTSAFFSPQDEYNFIFHALRTVAQGNLFPAASDAMISPTYVPDLVQASLSLLVDGESGIWHLANRGEVTWADFAREAGRMAGLDFRLVEDRPVADFHFPAPRPLFTALTSERGALMPDWIDALHRCVKAYLPRIQQWQEEGKIKRQEKIEAVESN